MLYLNNLKYAYKILYPGLKFSLVLLFVLLVVLVFGLYVFPKWIGIADVEVKLIFTVFTVAIAVGLLALVPFVFITGYSFLKGSQETYIRTTELSKKLLKILPFLILFIVLVVVIYVVISFVLNLAFGIPFFTPK